MSTYGTPQTLDSTWMETISSKVRNIETRLTSSVRKEKSPSLKMSLNSVNVYPTINEESKINVLDHDFAMEYHFLGQPTMPWQLVLRNWLSLAKLQMMSFFTNILDLVLFVGI